MLTEKILDAERAAGEQNWEKVLEDTVDFITKGTSTVGLPCWTLMDLNLDFRAEHLISYDKPQLRGDVGKSTKGMFFVALQISNTTTQSHKPDDKDILVWGFTREGIWILGQIHCTFFPTGHKNSFGDRFFHYRAKSIDVHFSTPEELCKTTILGPRDMIKIIVKRLREYEEELDGAIKYCRQRNAELLAVTRAIQAHS